MNEIVLDKIYRALIDDILSRGIVLLKDPTNPDGKDCAYSNNDGTHRIEIYDCNCTVIISVCQIFKRDLEVFISCRRKKRPDLHDELLDISHEYGHFESGKFTEERAQLWGKCVKDLSEEQARFIWEEESRAWDNARYILQRIGYAYWCHFDDFREMRLRSYECHKIKARV